MAGIGIAVAIEALQSRELEVRTWAVSMLGKAGDDARGAVPHLTRALSDDSLLVRVAAAASLGKLESLALEAGPALLSSTDSGNPVLRSMALYALGRLGPQAVPFLIEALQSERGQVRQLALVAINANLPALRGSLASIGVVVALRSALCDEDPRVRAQAARGLGLLDWEAGTALPELSEALHDEDELVARAAARALERIQRVS